MTHHQDGVGVILQKSEPPGRGQGQHLVNEGEVYALFVVNRHTLWRFKSWWEYHFVCQKTTSLSTDAGVSQVTNARSILADGNQRRFDGLLIRANANTITRPMR